MCLALSSSNSPRLLISAPPALVLLQRTFSGRIKQFISPFPPPHPPPPVLSPARLPPSWLRSCGRSRRARCASLVWNSSARSSESRQFPASPCPLKGNFVTLTIITGSPRFSYPRIALL